MIQSINWSLEVMTLGATLCAVVASFVIERKYGPRKLFTGIFLLLAVLSVGNYYDFGQRLDRVHHWEHFHFYLGSKYLSELRYDAIYEAAILASNENGHLLDERVYYRDPITFRGRTTPIPSTRRAAVRDRFTNERWREFKSDVQASLSNLAYLADHGNTGSPAWAMTASLFTRPLTYGTTSSYVFAYLDVAALLVLFAFVWRTFGTRALALAMIAGLSAPLLFRYLGGSLLRMDWLCALGISACLLEKRHFKVAGLVLGYAVASKLLAGIMVLPLGIRFIIQSVRERSIDRDQLRYILYALAGLGFFVLLSGLFFGELGLWRDYYLRMLATLNEHYYPNQHSFRDLFLQAVHFPSTLWQPIPDTLAAPQNRVSIHAVRVAFTVAQLALLGGLGFVAYRNPVRIAIALGPLAVFVVLVTNRYYWQMWLISAIVLAPTYLRHRRHVAFLAAIVAWFVAVNALDSTMRSPEQQGYFGSFLLFLIVVGLVAAEAVSWYRGRRGPRMETVV